MISVPLKLGDVLTEKRLEYLKACSLRSVGGRSHVLVNLLAKLTAV